MNRPHRQNYNLDRADGTSVLIQKAPFQGHYIATIFDRSGEEKDSRRYTRAALADWCRRVRRRDGFEILPR